jgi:hypothetical protein
MQNSFDTSFIPQQPLLKEEGFEHRRATYNLSTMLGLIILFTTVLVGAGVYIFDVRAKKEVTQLMAELGQKETGLKIDEIDRFKEEDIRFAGAHELLKSHVVFTPVLDFLSASTLQNVELLSLAYSHENDSVALQLSGRAASYEDVYLQGVVWNGMHDVVHADVFNVALDVKTGIVTFSAKIDLRENLVAYGKSSIVESGETNSPTGAPVPELVPTQMPVPEATPIPLPQDDNNATL